MPSRHLDDVERDERHKPERAPPDVEKWHYSFTQSATSVDGIGVLGVRGFLGLIRTNRYGVTDLIMSRGTSVRPR